MDGPAINTAEHAGREPDTGMALWRRMSAPMKDTIVNAQQQCLQQSSIVLDPSHVFAGLLMLPVSSSNALRLLTEVGLDVPSLAGSLRSSGFISVGDSRPSRTKGADYVTDLNISPEFNDLVRDAGIAADNLGQVRVGTEHLLLAFLANPSTHGCRVLSGFGVTLDAVRAKLAEWNASGNYTIESTAPGDGLEAISRSRSTGPGAVYQLYRATRIGYLITIFLPLVLRYIVPTATKLPVDHYLTVMRMTIYIYIFPYVLSTYAIAYLLRSRASKNLLGMPPLSSMAGVGVPFALSAAAGVMLILAMIPLADAMRSIFSLLTPMGGKDIFAFLCCIAMSLNCAATMTTHWLLTFNIRDWGKL